MSAQGQNKAWITRIFYEMVNRLIYTERYKSCNPCLKKNSEFISSFPESSEGLPLRLPAQMISPFSNTRVGRHGQVLRPSSVLPPYSCIYPLFRFLSVSFPEFAAAADDELAKFHLALFYFSLLRQQVALQGGVEPCGSSHRCRLPSCRREDDHVAVRDVQPVSRMDSQVYTEPLARDPVSQRFASPTAIFRHFKFADVDIHLSSLPRKAAASPFT